MLVSNIEKYDNRRFKITLNSNLSFLLYGSELKKFHIQEEQNISDTILDEIMNTLYKRARERALYLLDKTYKTKKQIKDKLISGLYPEMIIEKVILYLEECNLIDDKRYALLYIEYKQKTKSKRLIEQDLYIKGVCKEDISYAFENSDFSDACAISNIINKKIKNYDLTNKNEVQKFYRYLIGKGYDYSVVKEALREYMDEIY